ncbi:MAG: hypothetical protein QXF45_07820 [Candidatus Caldarchaeum sp.]
MVSVKLLPHGTFGRELILTALTPLVFSQALGGTSVEIREYEAVLHGKVGSLYYVFEAAKNGVTHKNALPKMKPHYNDVQVMTKIKKKLRLNCQDTYVDYGVALCEWAMNDLTRNPQRWEQSLESIEHTPKTIKLGDVNSVFSGFQPFKIEKYKYGKQFGNLRAQQDVQMDERWVALTMAGFLISYSTYSDGEMIFSTVPEETLVNAATDFQTINYVQTLTHKLLGPTSIQKYLNFVYELRSAPDLHHAYSLLLALHVGKHAKENNLTIAEAPPIVFRRVLFSGRSFSLMERISISISSLASFVHNLSDDAANILTDFLRCVLTLYRRENAYCSNRYGDFSVCNKIAKALYDAVNGSRSPAEVIYLMARSSPENSPLKYTKFLKEVYEAITG